MVESYATAAESRGSGAVAGCFWDQLSVAADAAGVADGDDPAALVSRAVAGPPAAMTTATAARIIRVRRAVSLVAWAQAVPGVTRLGPG